MMNNNSHFSLKKKKLSGIEINNQTLFRKSGNNGTFIFYILTKLIILTIKCTHTIYDRAEPQLIR